MTMLPDVPEASGVTASLRTPGILWTHNDGNDPEIFALDEKGTVKGRVRITGAKTGNWEAISVSRCNAGPCLYIGDIGDNDGKRKEITVYRIPEPLPGDSVSAEAQRFHATYPGGPQDAEAMWATPQHEVFIVTKGETGAVVVYRFPPATARNGKTVELEKIAKLETSDPKRKDMVTDAALSPDGSLVALRTKRYLWLYGATSLMSGHPGTPAAVDLGDLNEPQGEGVAFGPAGRIYLAGEGGAKGKPGTFARLRCFEEKPAAKTDSTATR
jgi:hypothetical protein